MPARPNCTSGTCGHCMRCAARRAAQVRRQNAARGVVSAQTQRRRARRARQQASGGAPPTSTAAPRRGPVYAPPPDPLQLCIEAISKTEDALVALAATATIAPETEEKFARYQKVKALALRATIPGERRSAIRHALLHINEIVKAVV